MKVAVLQGVRSITVEERPTPKIKENEALIHVQAAGICGSDLHGFQGKWPNKRAPGLVMGHEIAGEVVDVGKRVKTVKAGDKVAIDPQIPCGRCDECLRGWINVCSNMKLIGSSARGTFHGGFAEYIAMPEKNLHPLPENVSFREGAMIDPVGNSIHLINRAGVEVGDAIAILGVGTLGLCLLQAAKIAGANKIFVVDISEYRLKVAADLGANYCINAQKKNPVETILKTTDGKGVNVAIEAVGIKETYQQAISVVRKRGKVMALGNMADFVNVELFRFVSREVSMIGCTGFFPYEIDRSLELIAQGEIKVEPLITHVFSLNEIQKAFEILDEGKGKAIKVMLVP